jgi:hypothetical protein
VYDKYLLLALIGVAIGFKAKVDYDEYDVLQKNFKITAEFLGVDEDRLSLLIDMVSST